MYYLVVGEMVKQCVQGRHIGQAKLIFDRFVEHDAVKGGEMT
jgi:hypothetical protein